MIGEREDFNSETHYGALIMRSYNIEGNTIDAFYDSSDNLVFVLDNTINAQKPNVLLVINPHADKKWDEILSCDYGVDLETIRPKQDNKYQKFDIEYSGLGVYDALIKAFNAGDSLEDSLNQLMILRDSAARHSAMTRLNMANEIITKTNATIVKTRESIVRLNARLKTLRAKVAEAKKGIGREPTKQSAAKILKLESQIDATNEKIKRANERLKSAQRRLETANVDAELASGLLNQPGGEIKSTTRKVKPVVAKTVAPVVREEPDEEIEETVDYSEETDNTDDVEEYTEENTVEEEVQEEPETNDDTNVKPLFNEDPQILNNDIAFKPISFDAPKDTEKAEPETVPNLSREMLLTTTEETTEETETTEAAEEVKEEDEDSVHNEPVEEVADDTDKEEDADTESKPVLDSMLPVPTETVEETETTTETEIEPVAEMESNDKDKYEFSPIVGPVDNVSEITEEKPLNLTPVNEDTTRQQELVYSPETYTEPVKHDDEPAMPRSPIMPTAPVMPQMPSGMVHNAETEQKRKPSFIYYLLLIILIVLAVFTLWFYQKNIEPTTPVVTPSIERTTVDNKNGVLKKQPGARKPFKIKIEDKKKEEKNMPTFLDVQPVAQPEPEPEEVEVVVEKKPKVKEIVEEEVEVVKTEPEIMGAVPARVNSSGQPEEQTKRVLTEEEVLASKPAFQPGSKYDEMFVAEDGGEVVDDSYVEYVEEEPEYIPDADEELLEYEYTIDDDIQNPLYDAEEMEYQAEYQSEMYEE